MREPSQLTDGVYGVLVKYYFQNNANLWAWGLIGNKNRTIYSKHYLSLGHVKVMTKTYMEN